MAIAVVQPLKLARINDADLPAFRFASSAHLHRAKSKSFGDFPKSLRLLLSDQPLSAWDTCLGNKQLLLGTF